MTPMEQEGYLSEYEPDVFEAYERACENLMDEIDVDGSTYKCPFCGEIAPWAEAEASGPSPYSAPMCQKCAGQPDAPTTEKP
jgi:hypothetical protein